MSHTPVARGSFLHGSHPAARDRYAVGLGGCTHAVSSCAAAQRGSLPAAVLPAKKLCVLCVSVAKIRR